MNKSAAFLGLLVVLLTTACAPGGSAADYGVKVGFKKGAAVKYPDFVLTYAGRRHVATDRYPRGFDFHDFTVEAGQAKQTVSWSSGTGDIGPALFKVGSKGFALELARSDKLGKLKEDEVVISRSP